MVSGRVRGVFGLTDELGLVLRPGAVELGLGNGGQCSEDHSELHVVVLCWVFLRMLVKRVGSGFLRRKEKLSLNFSRRVVILFAYSDFCTHCYPKPVP